MNEGKEHEPDRYSFSRVMGSSNLGVHGVRSGPRFYSRRCNAVERCSVWHDVDHLETLIAFVNLVGSVVRTNVCHDLLWDLVYVFGSIPAPGTRRFQTQPESPSVANNGQNPYQNGRERGSTAAEGIGEVQPAKARNMSR
jgi:hypothetical protein